MSGPRHWLAVLGSVLAVMSVGLVAQSPAASATSGVSATARLAGGAVSILEGDDTVVVKITNNNASAIKLAGEVPVFARHLGSVRIPAPDHRRQHHGRT